jgi:NTE family protein
MGLAAGLLDDGVDLRHADLIVGTSAGAVVGARLALGVDPRSWDLSVDAAVGAAPTPGTSSGLGEMLASMARAAVSATPEAERASIGRMALAARTIDEEMSLARVGFDAFRGQTWPPSFRATAVAARTGAFRSLSPADGVALERGVAASAALPIAWPRSPSMENPTLMVACAACSTPTSPPAMREALSSPASRLIRAMANRRL